jgi:hypothetical protein
MRPVSSPRTGGRHRASRILRLVSVVAVASIALATAAGAREDPATMAAADEGVGHEAPGPWQGNWALTRDDPRLTTRASQALLRLAVIQSVGDATASVQWIADRAICPEPFDDPCEWIGAAGEVAGIVDAGGLYAVLPVAADPEDPFVLHLAADGSGLLFSRDGRIRYRIEHRREAP